MLFKQKKKELNDSRKLLITAGYLVLNISILLQLQNFPLVNTNN